MKLLGSRAPERIYALGNLGVLDDPLLGLLCSVKCPGKVILQTYDLMCSLRDAGVTVISGFHSPMEQECLRLLLRGAQPIVICPARSIWRRIPSELRTPLNAGRLLILSPFEDKHHRITAENAQYRNRFVAALADRILIPYAAPESKTEAFAREVERWGKRVVDRNELRLDRVAVVCNSGPTLRDARRPGRSVSIGTRSAGNRETNG